MFALWDFASLPNTSETGNAGEPAGSLQTYQITPIFYRKTGILSSEIGVMQCETNAMWPFR